MARITIVGAGITGMAIASMLSRHHDITIVARNLPGDAPSIEWASPWAGAAFFAHPTSSARDKKIQLDAIAEFQRIRDIFPESGIKTMIVEDFFGDIPQSDIWWKGHLPEFQFLPAERLPPGAKLGVSYSSVVMDPNTLLPWLRHRLEGQGVNFKRQTLTALSDAKSFGSDIVINATGVGSKDLTDIQDQDVVGIRGQTMIIRKDYTKAFMHDNGVEYTYCLPRMDGTMIIGGVRQPGVSDPNPHEDIMHDIVKRLNKNLPQIFSANLSDYDIQGHNVGIRPGRKSGLRIDSEVRDGLKIVHAYGAAGSGYIYSFGLARVVSELVDEFLFPAVKAKL